MRPPAEGANPPRGSWDTPTPAGCTHPSVSRLSWDQSREFLGKSSSPACAREAQRVSPLPRVVFVRPIGGRLDDLTHECLTTFGHSADAFVLSADTVPSFAVPPVDPPLLSIEYRNGAEERVPPPMGSMLGNSGLLLGESSETPLLLEWQEGIQSESLGTQFSAENPNSLGGKRSYAPFVSADGTTSSLVGNQTGLPHSEPRSDPPLGSWGSGLGGLVQ